MSDNQARSDRFAELRRQARELLELRQGDRPARSGESILDLIRELESSQAELENKNHELKRTHKEFSALHQEYSDIYELAPCGYLTLNPQEVITRTNRTGEFLFRTERERLKQMTLRQFIAPESQVTYQEALKWAKETQSSLSRELKLLRDDGSPLWVQANIQADLDESGEVDQYRLVLMDRSEKIKAEEKSRDLQLRLQQARKAESLSRMAGAIAHHFNNQLSAVLGNLELALDILPGETKVHENLVQAIQAAWRASEMSTLMLTYLGQNKAEVKILDLSETCRRELNKIQETMPKGMSLNSELTTPGPLVQANMGQLQQILNYLLSNARESIHKDSGEIHLSTRTIPASEIPNSHLVPVIWKPTADFYACLEITDSGCGMTQEDMEKIFDPFYSTKLQSRGLGLAVVLGIIKALNGAINVKSKPDRGSTFQVFLPLVVDEAFRQPETHEEGLEFQGSGTVLLVEDQDSVRSIVIRMLEHLGFEVLAAKEGQEAVRLLDKHKDSVRCVLTDLSMPGMDGWETMTAMRKIVPDIPVILASGYDQPRVMAGNHTELPQGFLGKPYQLSELKSTLIRVLQGSQG